MSDEDQVGNPVSDSPPTDNPAQADAPRVIITEKAALKIKEIIASEGHGEVTLRVRIVGGGCSGFQYDLYFEVETASPADKVFEQHGVKFIVDQMSLQYIYGTEIDYVEGLTGAGFKFNNPNIKATCGCGSSFNV